MQSSRSRQSGKQRKGMEMVWMGGKRERNQKKKDEKENVNCGMKLKSQNRNKTDQKKKTKVHEIMNSVMQKQELHILHIT